MTPFAQFPKLLCAACLLLTACATEVDRGVAAVASKGASAQQRAQSSGSRPSVAQLKKLFPEAYGSGNPYEAPSMLFWTHEQHKTGFQNVDRLLATRTLPASDTPYPLVSSPDKRLETLEYRLESAADGKRHSIADFMDTHQVGGVLVLKGNQILFERYGLENSSESRWVSFSVAKSVTSMLLGAALRDGYISNLDEPITTYLPRMRGSVYDKASIRDVLQMASGVGWNEDYEDPESDVSLAASLDGIELQTYLSALPRLHPPGEVFNYSTGETNLVGALVRSAIGNNLSSYATAKIWQGFGMASDANWLLNGPDGTELGGCCISATLRDYGRIGRFVLAEKAGRGSDAVLPDGWIDDSTKPSKGSPGYGYLWWLMGDEMFAALGIFGQSIFIDPNTDLVVVTHGATDKAVSEEFGAHRLALVNAIRALY